MNPGDEIWSVQTNATRNFWSNTSKIITDEVKNIKEKLSNDDAQIYLNDSFQNLEEKYNELNEYSTLGEKKDQFSDFVHGLHKKVFKNLKEAIVKELDLDIGDGTPLDIFFNNFFNYLNFIQFKKKFPEDKLPTGFEIKDFFKRKMEKEKWDSFLKMRFKLKNKGENNAEGYSAMCLLSNALRNIAEHKPKCARQDYVFKNIKRDDYGNFYIACNFFNIMIYSYLEVIRRWYYFSYLTLEEQKKFVSKTPSQQ